MAGILPPSTTTTTTTTTATKINEVDKKVVDYMNLPCPIPYEELHREALMSLKPELFEGMRFDFTKGLNQKFSLSHSVFMGPMELPSQSSETIKIPTAHYEFGANYIDPKLMLFGRVMTDGRLNARVKCDLTEDLTLKANAQLTNEPHMSHAMFNFDYKGNDYRTQLQLGNGALFGASYIQSVTPHFSLGGEVFWAGQHRKSGVGYAARYETDKMVGTGQVASTGMVALSYVQKVSEKVSLATDLMYNYMSRDVTASVGYDYILRQGEVDETKYLPFCTLKSEPQTTLALSVMSEMCVGPEVKFDYSAHFETLLSSHKPPIDCTHFTWLCLKGQSYTFELSKARLRGKIDSNGCTSAFLEERLNMGLNFILSAELDHKKKDYKFGFGLTVG